VGVTWEAIPSALDLSMTYTFAASSNTQPLIFFNGVGPTEATGGQFPDVRTSYQRLEAMAKYTFDDVWVRQMGWSGKVIAKLRYAWEMNKMVNWQNDMMQPYMYYVVPATGYMTWMAYDNPNYNVHVLGGSLTFAW
jgi:hypothetical protein